MEGLTPNGKAHDLVQKYIPFAYQSKGNSVKQVAKEAAIICCDEILEGLANGSFATAYGGAFEYWQSVKSEIKKMPH